MRPWTFHVHLGENVMYTKTKKALSEHDLRCLDFLTIFDYLHTLPHEYTFASVVVVGYNSSESCLCWTARVAERTYGRKKKYRVATLPIIYYIIIILTIIVVITRCSRRSMCYNIRLNVIVRLGTSEFINIVNREYRNLSTILHISPTIIDANNSFLIIIPLPWRLHTITVRVTHFVFISSVKTRVCHFRTYRRNWVRTSHVPELIRNRQHI